MLEKLKHPRSRKTFIAIVALAVVMSAGVNYFSEYSAKPWQYQSCGITADGQLPSRSSWCDPIAFAITLTNQLTTSFISAALVAILFIAIYSVVRDEEDSTTDVEIVFQPEQKRRHYSALQRATFWYHDGHLASWVRRHVLQEFSKRSSDDLAVRKIQAAIIDPRCEDACNAYLEYVDKLPKEQQRITDLVTLQADICATIFSFSRNYRSGILDLSIYLKREINFIRSDTCDSCSFWTTSGKDSPAIILRNRDSQCHYYNLSLQEHTSVIPKSHEPLDIISGNTLIRGMGSSELADQISGVMKIYFPAAPNFSSSNFSQSVVKRLNWKG